MFSINRIIPGFAASSLIVLSAAAQEPEFSPAQVQFFTDEVYPILSENCFECHGGGEKLKGGLYLTSREAMLNGGDSGAVFEMDDLGDSLFAEMISYADSFTEMPPDGKLPQEQIDILQEWIEMGAPWNPELEQEVAHEEPEMVIDEEAKSHWSFQPLRAPEIPDVPDANWNTNPIDALVYNRLRHNGLRPNPQADKIALIRRAYYDLIGLPPTPAEIRAFVNDESPAAFENVVDTLLASPHYGEKWARHWLDLVRYADSHGFERDENKPFIWRYRDYVVDSFNSDKPYDEFVKEQLAGDEYDEVTPERLIATGYYRLGQWDDEPADPKQATFDNLDDIVSTTSQAFMGITVGCARCHDHKIDPIPQKDYYSFLAFFRNITETKRTRDYGILRNIMNAAEQADFDKKQEEKNRRQAQLFDEQYDYIEAFKLAAKSDDLEGLRNRDARVSDLTDLTYRFYRNTWDRLPDFDMAKPETIDMLEHNYISTNPATRRSAIGFVYEGKLRVPRDGEYAFTVQARDGVRVIIDNVNVFESTGLGDVQNKFDSDLEAGLKPFRLEYFTKDGPPSLAIQWRGPGMGKRSLSLEAMDKEPKETIRKLIDEHGETYLGKEGFERYKQVLRELRENREMQIEGKWAPAVAEQGITPPDTHLLIRGSAHAPGDVVQPAFIQVLSPPEVKIPEPSQDKNTTYRRTTLAEWMTSEDHPLTARVMVNRIWQHHFGRGIVRSSNDFGKLGTGATHPLLLDWLAKEFMDNGWRMKPLHKKIMLSRTYQMSSRGNAKGLEKDPDNNFFWRYDMRRLTAEEIRDTLLTVTDEINLSLGGPTVFPTLPPEVIATSSKKNEIFRSGIWAKAEPEDEVRRSLYIHIKRSLIHPMLLDFDFADVDSSCPVRFTTTQPAQALAMLNSDYVNERAIKLYDRVTAEVGKDDRNALIARAFELTTGRQPSPKEMDMSHAYLNELEQEDSLSPERADQRFCLLVLNLNEFLFLD